MVLMVAGLLSAGMTTAQAVDSGIISGKVTKLGGAALADIDVTVYKEFDDEGETYWDEAEVDPVVTEADGTYSVTGLAAGTYRIGFDDFASGNYIGEYFENKDNIDEASDIVVETGATAAGKNAELAVAAHITGKVTKSGGTALSGIDVTAYEQVNDDGDVYWEEFGYAMTSSTGTYDLGALPGGSYRIGFDDFEYENYLSEYFENKDNVDEATDIDVASGATASGKNAQLADGGHITGKVTDSGVALLSGIDVTAYELVDLGDGETSWEEFGYGWTQSDGTFDVGGLPTGTYRIGFDDFERGDYASEFYDDKGRVEDAANIAVIAGATTSGKNAKLADASHITGKVTSPGGGGLEEIEVSAYQLVDDVEGPTGTRSGVPIRRVTAATAWMGLLQGLIASALPTTTPKASWASTSTTRAGSRTPRTSSSRPAQLQPTRMPSSPIPATSTAW